MSEIWDLSVRQQNDKDVISVIKMLMKSCLSVIKKKKDIPLICGWGLKSGLKGIVYDWTGIVRALSLKAGTDGHLLWPPVTNRVCRCNCPWGADEVVCWFVLSPGSTEKHDIFMKKTDFMNLSWWKRKHVIHFYIFKCLPETQCRKDEKPLRKLVAGATWNKYIFVCCSMYSVIS